MANQVSHATDSSPWTAESIAQLNTEFADQPPEALLQWASAAFGRDLVLTCSFGGPTGMVLLDMVTRIEPNTPVVFLDTDLLFPETYALAEAAARHYGIMIERRRPTLSLADQDLQEGAGLYARDPDRCCAIRKVTPLAEALRPYAAWISGVRRDQSSTRATTDLVQWSSRHGLLKLNPLAHWSEPEVWAYIHRQHVPYNPLLDAGYASLGCAPCTRPSNDADPRAGRWSGFAKVECGIHL